MASLPPPPPSHSMCYVTCSLVTLWFEFGFSVDGCYAVWSSTVLPDDGSASSLTISQQTTSPRARRGREEATPIHATPPPPPIRRCHPHARKFASQAALSRMQVTLHCCWKLFLPGQVKTRRVLSRNFRGATVYVHTTTAAHDMSTPPPPPVSIRLRTCMS